MADTVRFDVSGLSDLAEDLRGAGMKVARAAGPIVRKGALNIKTDARDRVTRQIRRRYLPWYPSSITYDVSITHLGVTGGRVTAEIGPETGRKQGAFGPGVEFGSANHAPIPHLIPALEAEAPNVEQQLLAAAVRSLLR